MGSDPQLAARLKARAEQEVGARCAEGGDPRGQSFVVDLLTRQVGAGGIHRGKRAGLVSKWALSSSGSAELVKRASCAHMCVECLDLELLMTDW